RFSDGSAARWAKRVDGLASAVSGPAVRVGAAVHSVRAVDPASIKVAVEWARDGDAPLHFHASEQPAENEQCLAVHGRTPVEVIAQAGGLGPGTTLVHATHVTEHDLALIGEAGAHCCFCPTTEHDLADGVGPAEALARNGARLCVGSD
ncbi:MAG: amidohydrolase family protein, partial [Acidimicrobiaceae bacterium]|nr:amidohydrolase family protein [Acidimicrobiaceae bacterium]